MFQEVFRSVQKHSQYEIVVDDVAKV